MSEGSRPFLTAQWRNLVMLTYAVDPASLIDRVPVGTTLDCWRGQTPLSLVAFQFLDTRILGAPVPFHQDFEEVNLRFYVRHAMDGGRETRPGVVFLRELVPRPIVGSMARLLYREPYMVVPMRSRVDPGPPPGAEYQWDTHGRWSTLAASGDGDGTPAAPGSLEEFVTARNWGYNGEPGKATLEYQVDHPHWRIWHARDVRADYDAAALCSPEIARQLKKPISALVADGSAVTIHWRTQITA